MSTVLASLKKQGRAYPKCGFDVEADDPVHARQEGLRRFMTYTREAGKQSGCPGRPEMA